MRECKLKPAHPLLLTHVPQPQDGTFSCMELYRNGTQILIGCGQKGLVAYDLISGKSTGQVHDEENKAIWCGSASLSLNALFKASVALQPFWPAH